MIDIATKTIMTMNMEQEEQQKRNTRNQDKLALKKII